MDRIGPGAGSGFSLIPNDATRDDGFNVGFGIIALTLLVSQGKSYIAGVQT